MFLGAGQNGGRERACPYAGVRTGFQRKLEKGY